MKKQQRELIKPKFVLWKGLWLTVVGLEAQSDFQWASPSLSDGLHFPKMARNCGLLLILSDVSFPPLPYQEVDAVFPAHTSLGGPEMAYIIIHGSSSTVSHTRSCSLCFLLGCQELWNKGHSKTSMVKNTQSHEQTLTYNILYTSRSGVSDTMSCHSSPWNDLPWNPMLWPTAHATDIFSLVN